MLNIVVFNWNYSEFLNNLLREMQVIFNNSQYRVFICDDGSTDDSLEIIDDVISKFCVGNVIVLKRENPNFGRKKPYQGQLESLRKVIDSEYFSKAEHYWLMDADDYCNFSSLPDGFVEKVRAKKVSFTKVKNINQSGIEDDLLIKRSVLDSRSLFPTISVTSSIIASGTFLLENRELIYAEGFDDVWLDSRLNMLACLLKRDEVEYLDEVVYRLIHGANDSAKMSLLRMLDKQISAHDYFRFIHGNKLMINPRMLLLTGLSAIKNIK
ncbi:hypothetical protein [Vibrio parahaemolyticus]|uniref:hypothetical protein n=1 Tax=Vibrio parahaemolyticus TaxID=670 RepID=UPI0011EF31D0|nr:hypothetical protein [Vibrio parahaemolyticus]KAB5599851.1 hypothetical protein F0578_08005 [Vibrio parahaemolyticus]HCM1316280.1 hypothetical protein [Vibrio parahaemolyticus]